MTRELRELQESKDPPELKEDKVHPAPLESLVRRERLEYPAFQVQLAETDSPGLVGCQEFLVLKVILGRMVSREKLDLPAPKDSKEARATLDQLEAPDQEDSGERLDPLAHLGTKVPLA